MSFQFPAPAIPWLFALTVWCRNNWATALVCITRDLARPLSTDVPGTGVLDSLLPVTLSMSCRFISSIHRLSSSFRSRDCVASSHGALFHLPHGPTSCVAILYTSVPLRSDNNALKRKEIMYEIFIFVTENGSDCHTLDFLCVCHFHQTSGYVVLPLWDLGSIWCRAMQPGNATVSHPSRHPHVFLSSLGVPMSICLHLRSFFSTLNTNQIIEALDPYHCLSGFHYNLTDSSGYVPRQG